MKQNLIEHEAELQKFIIKLSELALFSQQSIKQVV